MKTVFYQSIIILALMLASLSCKSRSRSSSLEDHINVTADGNAAYVVWLDTKGNDLDADDTVHYDVCNPLAVPAQKANRNCPGKIEVSPPLPYQDYVDRLNKGLTALNGNAEPSDAAKRTIDKLARLQAKVNEYKAAPSTSKLLPDDFAAFEKQIPVLQSELSHLPPVLTEDQRKLFVELLRGLRQGDDITKDSTYDEGEMRFELSQAPFGPGFQRVLSLDPTFDWFVTGGKYLIGLAFNQNKVHEAVAFFPSTGKQTTIKPATSQMEMMPIPNCANGLLPVSYNEKGKYANLLTFVDPSNGLEVERVELSHSLGNCSRPAHSLLPSIMSITVFEWNKGHQHRSISFLDKQMSQWITTGEWGSQLDISSLASMISSQYMIRVYSQKGPSRLQVWHVFEKGGPLITPVPVGDTRDCYFNNYSFADQKYFVCDRGKNLVRFSEETPTGHVVSSIEAGPFNSFLGNILGVSKDGQVVTGYLNQENLDASVTLVTKSGQVSQKNIGPVFQSVQILDDTLLLAVHDKTPFDAKQFQWTLETYNFKSGKREAVGTYPGEKIPSSGRYVLPDHFFRLSQDGKHVFFTGASTSLYHYDIARGEVSVVATHAGFAESVLMSPPNDEFAVVASMAEPKRRFVVLFSK